MNQIGSDAHQEALEAAKRKQSEYKLCFHPDADEFLLKVVNRIKSENGNNEINWDYASKIFISEKEGGQTFKPSEITGKRLHDRFENYLKPNYDFSELNQDEITRLINFVESGDFSEKGRISWKKLTLIFGNRSPNFLKNTYHREKKRIEKPEAKRRKRCSGPRKD